MCECSKQAAAPRRGCGSPRGENSLLPLAVAASDRGETWDPPVAPNPSPTLLQAELIRVSITLCKPLDNGLLEKGKLSLTASISEIAGWVCVLVASGYHKHEVRGGRILETRL